MIRQLYLLVIIYCITLGYPCWGTETNHWETVVFPNQTWKYFIGKTSPSEDWYTESFNDQNWNSGTGGFGYGDLKSGTTITSTASLFLRITFTIEDTSVLNEGLFSIDYDDAFVAFINGFEISRSEGLTDKHPLYNQLSKVDHESKLYKGGDPDGFYLSKKKIVSFIKPGKNVLCIQIHNYSLTSSDLIAIPYLSFGISSTKIYYTSSPISLIKLFSSSNLPIIKIDTQGQTILDSDYPGINATMGIIYNGENQRNGINDTYNNYNGNIDIFIRGSSSQMFPKKNYGFETLDVNFIETSNSLLNLPKESDWILYAPYSDKTCIRNVLTYDLAGKFGRYAPRTKYCELFINDDYRGIYVLIEKIKHDKNRVDIATLKPTELAGDSLTGGYILKIDRGYDGTNGFVSNYNTNGDIKIYPNNETNGYPINFTFVYPKPAEIKPEQSSYIKKYISDFENIMHSDDFANPNTGYAKYIDVGSFVDHFLINEFTKNVDAYRLSEFMYKDKDSKGGKLTSGPVWDYDLTYGNANYYDGEITTGWTYNVFPLSETSPPPFWWGKLISDPSFQNKLKCRWIQLRQTSFNQDTIFNFIDKNVALLAEAKDRNFSTWPILDQNIWPNYKVSGSYEGEISYFKNWISERLNWLDNNLPGTANCTTSNQSIEKFSSWITVSPNPFVDFVDFSIVSPKKGRIIISIVDITGKKVTELTGETPGNDMVHIYWHGNNSFSSTLAAGLYFYSVSIDKEIISNGKLIKN